MEEQIEMFKKNEFINVRQETEEEYIFFNTKTGETFLLKRSRANVSFTFKMNIMVSDIEKFKIFSASRAKAVEKNILIQGDTTE